MSALLCSVLMVVPIVVQSRAHFMFGTATAAYQIEGAIDKDGRLPSIWDVFCEESGKVHNGDSGKIADDSYNRWREDIQMMKALNLTNYRMSLSWARILPDGHTVNEIALQHYRNVINELLAEGIEPFVTLYHWDLPQAVYEETYGGWINESIVDYFVNYAETVFFVFGKMVKNWLTFNEPWTFCVEGYDGGQHAPGRCSDRNSCPEGNSGVEVYQCAHSVLLSHAAAVKKYREKGYDQYGNISITLNVDWAEPASESEEDKAAAQRNLLWQVGWFADPIFFGDYPQEMRDYVGYRLPVFTLDQKADLQGIYRMNELVCGR